MSNELLAQCPKCYYFVPREIVPSKKLGTKYHKYSCRNCGNFTVEHDDRHKEAPALEDGKTYTEKMGIEYAGDKFDDLINHPPHYTQGGIECIDAIQAALGVRPFIDFLRGQILKYIWRGPHKDTPLENYKKAQFYLDRLIKELEE